MFLLFTHSPLLRPYLEAQKGVSLQTKAYGHPVQRPPEMTEEMFCKCEPTGTGGHRREMAEKFPESRRGLGNVGALSVKLSPQVRWGSSGATLRRPTGVGIGAQPPVSREAPQQGLFGDPLVPLTCLTLTLMGHQDQKMLEKKPVKLKEEVWWGTRESAGYRRKLFKVIIIPDIDKKQYCICEKSKGSPLGRSGAQGIGFLLPYRTTTVKIQDISITPKISSCGVFNQPSAHLQPLATTGLISVPLDFSFPGCRMNRIIAFLIWFLSVHVTSFGFVHGAVWLRSVALSCCVTVLRTDRPQSAHPLASRRAFGLFLVWGSYE